MTVRLVPVLLALALTACSSVQHGPRGWIEPAEAVRAANDDPGYGVRGRFVMVVKAIGHDRGRTYLNSERDYRHQTCLTVAMNDAVARSLALRLGVAEPELRNRRIVVQGTARRVRIDLLDDRGKRTGLHYFQTHVVVDSPTQVEFAG